jgi:lipoprotein-releasing system permease protein
MNSFSFFLARRFYGAAGHDRRRRASRWAIAIATGGVAIGLAVMIITVCVVKGFQTEIRGKLTGFASHLEVLDFQSFTSPESYPIVTDSVLIQRMRAQQHVTHVARVALKMGMVKTEEAFQTIILKGVGEDYDTAFLQRQMVEGRLPHFSGPSEKDEVLVSRRQADRLHLHVGSKIYAYFFSDDIRLRRFTVTGIYETHLAGFDDSFMWTSRATVLQLNGWNELQSSSLEIYLDDFDAVSEVQRSIGSQLNGRHDIYGGTYNTLSVKENPRTSSAVQWITLLDLNLWLILILVIGVAGFTVVSGLLILILERTQTIGILKALGATNARIRRTFIAYATLIVVRGLFWGNILGIGLVVAQQLWGFARLDPTAYYVDTVPVVLLPGWLIGVNVATLVITVLALIVPSYIVSRIRPAKAIRFE